MAKTLFDEINFLVSLILQCPDNSVVALQCNWTSTTYSETEIAEINNNCIHSVEDCKTDRQLEIFKSHQFKDYKYQDTQFVEFEIWDGGLNLLITKNNSIEIVERLKKYFNNGDVCHCQIYTEDKQIAECYDTFMHNRLDSNLFRFTTVEKQRYSDNDIDIYFDSFN